MERGLNGDFFIRERKRQEEEEEEIVPRTATFYLLVGKPLLVGLGQMNTETMERVKSDCH